MALVVLDLPKWSKDLCRGVGELDKDETERTEYENNGPESEAIAEKVGPHSHGEILDRLKTLGAIFWSEAVLMK